MKNFIIIFNDDHGQWALPSYGNCDILSPNINFLSSNGITFLNSFTPTPVCSPARANFFTGLRTSDHGVHDFIGEPGKDKDWLSEFVTLPEILQNDYSYNTSIFGKWHLGRDNEKKQYFDHWFVEVGQYPFTHKMEHNFMENSNPKTIYGYRDQIITDYFINWIKEYDVSKPFFSFIGFNGTHSPWEGHPKRLVEYYKNKKIINKDQKNILGMKQVLESETYRPQSNNDASLEEYYASITHIDEKVGRILDILEIKNLLEETLIIYTSDHGLCCGQHGVWGKSNGTIPSNLFEESIRIPLILFSGENLVRKKSNILVDHLDTYATIIDLVDENYELKDNYFGKSYKNYLFSLEEEHEFKEIQIIEYGNLIALKNHEYKFIYDFSNNQKKLINPTLDKSESNNLITKTEFETTVNYFNFKLDEYLKSVSNSKYSVINYQEQINISGVEPWIDL